ncbi:TonB-dependent receptor [Glaciecola sp. MH2013]|uniref:TonB-dependent receptor domain-containing protein n=1 Tax=Glaciecola sp. MH2013 TaxID=2785524 RepID=UPI0018A0EF71|nr:TonB-dependent receptor [Glaciecola sp. MH2013]MBF7073386.1 TonB-dependent receptor [Glaciecola sp. MH2013]
MKSTYRHSAIAAALLIAMGTHVQAQETEEAKEEKKTYEQIVVTASPGGATQQETSVSVSSFNEEDIFKLAARSSAEVFRALPGIRAESSGGGGNANITIRGIPLATGGSKFLQIHEDGLPVLEYGDINFGNADNFLRYDWSVGLIEAVRGGSASTFASNSPGGVINMISNTGESGGGAIGTSFGVDYDEFRLDFSYGGEINDDLYFHIGGFARGGEGTRETGFNGDQGGQVKFNITQLLENGFIRFYFKNLDDKVTTYLPAPVRVRSNGDFGPVENFDASSQTLHSAYTTNVSTFDSFGNPRNRDVTDGIHSQVTSIGFEANIEIDEGLTFINKFRSSDISGSFISPFTDTFGDYGPQSAQSMAANICNAARDGDGNPFNCSSTTVTLANGPGAGEQYTGDAFLNLQFDTSIKDLGNLINDMNITKEFDGGFSVTAGYYYSMQDIASSWNSWNTFIQTVDGSNSQYLTITDADGETLVNDGLWAPSFLSWEWDLRYQTTAPYLNIGYELNDNVLLDASVRRDTVQANGELINSCCGGNADFDLNGDGVISGNSEDASASNGFGFGGGVINLNRAGAASQIVNYEASNTSYSFGGSYLLDDSKTIFARYSKGSRAIADRLLQIAGTLNADGSLTSTTSGFDETKQLEIGFKYATSDLRVYTTLFDTVTEDTQAELTSGLTFIREYEATGLEVEGSYELGSGFTLIGNMTWTDAEISGDAFNPSLVGKTPRRQADLIYTLTPQYQDDNMLVGASLQGSSEYFVGDSNELKQDGFTLVNLFATYYVTDEFSVSLNVNNLTDEFVITESEESAASAGDIIRARPLNGRTTSLSLKYTFE